MSSLTRSFHRSRPGRRPRPLAAPVRIALVALLYMGTPTAVLWADTTADLQERIARIQRTYDERLAEYNAAVEAMTRHSGEVEAAEFVVGVREERMAGALEELEKVLKFIKEHPDTALTTAKEKDAYAAAKEAHEEARRSLNEGKERVAAAKGEAAAVYAALQGYRDELANLHGQLANARYRKLQEELSQDKTVVVREELGCEDLTVRACREGALELAQRSAVEKGSAVLVESSTVMEDLRVVLDASTVAESRQVTKDWIESHVTGVLVSHEVLDRGWVGETGYYYEIEAVVKGRLSKERYLEVAGTGEVPVLPAKRFEDGSLEKVVGEVFRDCEECPELVVVPAGSFMMGSPESEEDRYDDEGPVHRVRIAEPFAVGVYEVTFGEWDACVRGGGCGGYEPDDEGWGRGDRPVISVSWEDARAYVSWLSRRTGQDYRLLSEAEWEYVARAGTATPFHFGRAISTAQANYNGNFTYENGRKGQYRRQAVPVGSFSANDFGVHDVHGNVWEWTEDCWNDNYMGPPTDGSAWERGDCGRRAVRGGSWYSRPGFLRSAFRYGFTAGDRGILLGFRAARTLTS